MVGRGVMRSRGALRATAGLGAVLALALTGCSGSSSGGATADATSSATQSATLAPPTTAGAAVTAPTSAAGASTSLDPCTLVTSAEASALAGTTFGAGQETANGNGKRCTYGARTLNVFTVEVVAAQDAATAQSVWAEAQSEAKAATAQQLPPGLHISLNTDSVAIGDKAATVSGGANLAGHSFGFSGIYVLKGATFFAFQDLLLTKAPPAESAMEAQARTTLTRVS